MHFLTSLSLLASTAVALPSLLERASPISGKNVTLMPLGDSITWGMTDPNSNGYRARLYSKLQTAGATPLDFIGSVRAGTFADPDNQGRIGYTVQQIASDAASVANLRPNVVLLHAGTNDALRQYQTSDKAISDLQKLVDQIFTQWPKTALILAKVVPCANNADNGQPTQPYLNAINAAVPCKSFSLILMEIFCLLCKEKVSNE